MGRRGRKLPALGFADLERVLLRDGWIRAYSGTSHAQYEHPTKPGKVTLSRKWRSVSTKDSVFHSVLHQAQLSRKHFEKLYWEAG